MKDVIIIGAGAVGTTIARSLSKYNLNLLVLERGIEACEETSKANSAIVHGGYDAKPGSLKAELNVAGSKMFNQLSKELGFTYKKIGSLVLAFDYADEKVLEDLYAQGLENGVDGLKIISGERARQLEPFISKDVTQALYCSSAGIVDPFNYTYSMLENAIENGAEFKSQENVIKLDSRKDYILVTTDKNQYSCRILINAAGLASDKIAHMAGDYDFSIIPTKGVYRLLAKNKYQELGKVLFQTPSKKGKGVLVTPTYAGNTMLGPTSTKIFEDSPVDLEESLGIIDKLSKKTMPYLNPKTTIRVFEGIRAKPTTGDFMIYYSAHMKNLIHVAGIESPGLSSSPAIGEYVRDMVLNLVNFSLKEDFNPFRQAIPKIRDLGHEEKDLLFAENPLYENIICRCEGISEGEIIDAIRSRAGAISQGGVKRRVRAGMGQCQGSYCGPKVREIIARELSIPIDQIKRGLTGEELIKKYFG